MVGLGVLAGAGAAASSAAAMNTTLPTITGTPQDGKTLTADKGTWNNGPSDYNYFWRRCDKSGNSCSNISGANERPTPSTSADVGHTLRFRVQAKNADGSSIRFIGADRGDHCRRNAPTAKHVSADDQRHTAGGPDAQR